MSRITSFALRGIEAEPIDVESTTTEGKGGSPRRSVVGLPDAAVRESLERVHAALRACGFGGLPHESVVNLAPADLRKEGPVYDLPIALSLLGAAGTLSAAARARLARTIVAGELALDGSIRSVRGVTSMSMLARERGALNVLIPTANAVEAAIVRGIEVVGVHSLREAVEWAETGVVHPREVGSEEAEKVARVSDSSVLDFVEIRGQEAAKRALLIAAAGAHNALLVGPAGSGKTMMARAMAGILPPLTEEEALEITRVYSVALGGSRQNGLVRERPFRSPHHSASMAAIIGGGSIPRPGEVTLAHLGVLFLDELPEFGRQVLEGLREPLEDGFISIARASSRVRFPARPLLIAAMNPSHAGGFGNSPQSMRDQERYIGKLSGPLLDRIDIHVAVRAVGFAALTSRREGMNSARMRAIVEEARLRMDARQGPARPNAFLRSRELDQFAALDAPSSELLSEAIAALGLSARAYDKVRRVARTVADMEGSKNVLEAHVAEAVQYRLLDRHKSAVTA
ncbi:MAG: ATP-binding protein [Phycisphaerales bacterium]|nr:ATP-binding protein [Phycisphaerales bacterium]